MARIKKILGALYGLLVMSAVAAPVTHSQALPGGSVEVPRIDPIAVAVPPGSVAQHLPALPGPFFWADPLPAAPGYVASNWVEPFSFCPARNQRAFAQDGTQLWCTNLDRTDARIWAPYTSNVPWTRDFEFKPMTRVANSLGGEPCGPVGATAIDPSNGQAAYCGISWLDSEVPVWLYEPGS